MEFQFVLILVMLYLVITGNKGVASTDPETVTA
jgi:hypothetical protein